jgi:hypothetical protein
MRNPPLQTVTCNKCFKEEQFFLSDGGDCWLESVATMNRAGWEVKGKVDLCPACVKVIKESNASIDSARDNFHAELAGDHERDLGHRD